MGKFINILYQPLIVKFFLLIILFLIFSCSQNNSKKPDAPEKKDELTPPVTIPVKAPKVTLLDTCPPPLTITIPSKKADSFILKINNSNTVIRPPEIKPADFSVLMQHYNTSQGLANSAVKSGCMDKSGNLWFATFGGGVSRYDGKTFTSYTASMGLVSNLATCIFEDKDRNLWIGTRGGVSRYNGKFFTSYTTAQGLVKNEIYSIFQDKGGNLWFGTEGGASRYDGKTFKSYTTTEGAGK